MSAEWDCEKHGTSILGECLGCIADVIHYETCDGVRKLTSQLDALRADNKSWKEHYEELMVERDRYREALEKAGKELGIPRLGYPAPVANAADIIQAALGESRND